jgi:2-polyprenyl-3-methyl-5-hydroxy-6-metoxy-1,4-benzoquinol methylase
MRAYYEELWEHLPDDLEPPDLDVRLAFMREGVRSGEHVLDLGSGEGTFTEWLARIGAAPLGAEVADAAVRRARAAHPELEFRLVPIDGSLPLQDNSFDVVWATEVIEHVADTGRWLSEVRRVLKPGGRLLLTTPSHGRLRVALGGIERFSQPLGDHLHLYTRASLSQLLREFGFGEVSVRAAGGPPFWRRLLLARAVR